MGYKVKIQKIQRAANKTYYVNFPGAFAEAVNLEKGEQMEWFIEGRNCFVLKRVKEAGSFLTSAKEESPKRRNVSDGTKAAGAARNKSR
jgi:bifunctional DNA-binding transcriptional regulator/antitoxin component of YhaV-PrlF toxin-antitoxin module